MAFILLIVLLKSFCTFMKQFVILGAENINLIKNKSNITKVSEKNEEI